MPKTRIPSPARSQGAPVTPRRHKPRGTRSVGSPARSTTSGRLSSIVDQFKENNRDSYAPSPLCKTLLSDNTDIEKPRRSSWWKKVDNSGDVMEILDSHMLEKSNNVVDELDVEVLSQEKEYTVDLPESSGSESISSIVIPQRKLFTQKENKPQNQFDELIGPRESLSRHNKTNLDHDKTAKVGPKNLFGQRPKRPQPVFPAALLKISPDKTIANKTKELPAEVKGQPRNLFGKQPGFKRKNMFADFVMSESEDETPEIQPRVFTFHKPDPVSRRSSNMSIATDIEMDDWKLLPSSTMVDHQLDAITPGKDRLSKLSEAKESDVGSKNITVNKTKQSHESVVDISTKKLVEAAPNTIAVTDTIQDQQDEDEDFSLTYDDNDPAMDQQNQENVMNKSEHQIPQQDISDHVNNDGAKIMGEEIHEKNYLTEQENIDAVEEIDEKIIKSIEKAVDGDIQENNVDINKADVQENYVSTNDKEKELKTDVPTNEIGAADEKKERDQIEIEVANHKEIEVENQNEVEVENQNEIEVKDQNEIEVENQNEIEVENQNEVEVENQNEIEVENQNEIEVENQNEIEVENQKEIEGGNQKGIEGENQIEDEDQNEEDESINNQAAVESYEIETKQQEYEKRQIDKDVQDISENVISANDEEKEIDQEEMEVEDQNEEEKDIDNQSTVESDEEIETEQQEYEKSQVDEELNEEQDDDVSDVSENETSANDDEEERDQEEMEVEDQNEVEENIENQAAVESDEEIETGKQEYEESQENDDLNEEHNEDVLENKISANDEEKERDQAEIEVGDQNEEEEEIDNKALVESDDEIETEQQEYEESQVDDELNEEQNDDAQVDGKETEKEDEENAEIEYDASDAEANIGGTENRPSIKLHRDRAGISSSLRPNIAPHSDSTSMSEGTKNSSAEGSGWDSHRTTRKTLRLTFGKDFTPRKSLRALVMEKSAKRQTAINEANAALRLPKANSTELPQANSTEIPIDNLQSSETEYEEQAENFEISEKSDHKASKRMRQTALEEYLQKLKSENIERNRKIEEKVKNMFKPNPARIDYLKQVPHKPAVRRIAKPVQAVPKKRQKLCLISEEELPEEFLEDLKYKPPKRFRPRNASWITNRLYNFLETKLVPQYDYRARVRAEKLVEMIYNFTQDVRKLRIAPLDSVAQLKKEMARLKIVKTHYEFYIFFREYMPLEIKIKVVPDIVNQIPVPRNVFEDIITET